MIQLACVDYPAGFDSSDSLLSSDRSSHSSRIWYFLACLGRAKEVITSSGILSDLSVTLPLSPLLAAFSTDEGLGIPGRLSIDIASVKLPPAPAGFPPGVPGTVGGPPPGTPG